VRPPTGRRARPTDGLPLAHDSASSQRTAKVREPPARAPAWLQLGPGVVAALGRRYSLGEPCADQARGRRASGRAAEGGSGRGVSRRKRSALVFSRRISGLKHIGFRSARPRPAKVVSTSSEAHGRFSVLPRSAIERRKKRLSCSPSAVGSAGLGCLADWLADWLSERLWVCLLSDPPRPAGSSFLAAAAARCVLCCCAACRWERITALVGVPTRPYTYYLGKSAASSGVVTRTTLGRWLYSRKSTGFSEAASCQLLVLGGKKKAWVRFSRRRM